MFEVDECSICSSEIHVDTYFVWNRMLPGKGSILFGGILRPCLHDNENADIETYENIIRMLILFWKK